MNEYKHKQAGNISTINETQVWLVEASWSYSDIPDFVGLWKSDQPNAETSLRDNKQHSQQISMSPGGFEPAIPADERPQTLVLDRTATETG